MNTDIELAAGNWLLVLGPRSICPTLLMMIARLPEEEPVWVVDGGMSVTLGAFISQPM
jgi:hypothetical protein